MRTKRPGAWLALALALATGSGVRAQQASEDSAITACERADTSTAWRAAGKAWKARHAGQQPKDEALRRQLLAMADSDQAVRHFFEVPESARDTLAMRRTATRDSVDEAELRRIVARHGWTTVTLVGADGASAAWLIAQHNFDIQQEALRLMLALPPSEVDPQNLAMLQDRVLVHEGKRQRYGTQLDALPPGQALRFNPIEDPARVDQRRAGVGLPPLKVYACIMRVVYHTQVLEPR